MLWHRTNASGLITKFLKVPRIVNAINLRKFKNLISWFEIEISSFSSFFSLFSLCSFFHLHFWLSVIIRATLRQRPDISNPSNIKLKIKLKIWNNNGIKKWHFTRYSEKLLIWSYVGEWKEPQFPHLGTFHIRKIQLFWGDPD